MTSPITDEFTRANSATNLGSTDQAIPWVQLFGTWGISSDQAYVSVIDPTGDALEGGNLALIDHGWSDGIIELDVITIAADPFLGAGVLFRWIDANNYWIATVFYQGGTGHWQLEIDKIVAGVATYGSSPDILSTNSSFSGPLHVKVELNGSSIAVTANGTLTVNITDSDMMTGHSHGLYLVTVNDRLDNYSAVQGRMASTRGKGVDFLFGHAHLAGSVAPPINDNWASASLLVGATGALTMGTNIGSTFQYPAEDLSYVGNKTRSVWWKWVCPATGDYKFDTFGSKMPDGTTTLDTVLDVWSGASLAGLTQLGFSDNASDSPDSGGTTSAVSFHATSGTTYYIRVFGHDETQQGTIHLNWAPTILESTTGAGVVFGGSPTLTQDQPILCQHGAGIVFGGRPRLFGTTNDQETFATHGPGISFGEGTVSLTQTGTIDPHDIIVMFTAGSSSIYNNVPPVTLKLAGTRIKTAGAGVVFGGRPVLFQ